VRYQELQELVNQELSVIQQTSNALNQCCHGNSAFAGSAEAVECHRLLLVACEQLLIVFVSLCFQCFAPAWVQGCAGLEWTHSVSWPDGVGGT